MDCLRRHGIGLRHFHVFYPAVTSARRDGGSIFHRLRRLRFDPPELGRIGLDALAGGLVEDVQSTCIDIEALRRAHCDLRPWRQACRQALAADR